MTMLYSQCESLNTAPMGDELVMMDVTQGKYFGLNPLAAHIWQLLAVPISLDALVNTLVQHFDVCEHECRADTQAFLLQLVDQQLVKVQTAA